jgi:signal transduction histidine kinase
VKEDLPPIKADLFKLEQMLLNLLDNAVKYTDHGDITISAHVEDKRVRIQVRDTGIGIPKEDIPRIFERFYVVDKSRSRKSGGTGLGLSIVKHIVLLHHGTIDIESDLGKGTKVTVTIPTNLSAS